MGIPVPFLRRGDGKKKESKEEEPKEAWRTREYWQTRIDRYFWECENRPDYTKDPRVDEELERAKDPVAYDLKKMSPEEREKALKDKARFESSFEHKLIQRNWELQKRRNAAELAKNDTPTRKEDTKLWRSTPHVPGPDGLPMVRKALSIEEADGRMMDFLKEHLFGLWGYRQRPYPTDRPIDAAQAFGYKFLHKRYADFHMRGGGWYYKDRMGRTRGPMELINMQTAWTAGIIDKNTFIWGEDMDEWAPIRMVYGLEQCVNRWEVKMITNVLHFGYKLAYGFPLNAHRKGYEPKTLHQLQQEALELRDRERAVLKLNGGVWPGEREPSHSLFLWATGSQLTDNMKPSRTMRDKFISYPARKKLMELCPALRPKDFLNIEKVFDAFTYQADWFREPLGTFSCTPDFQTAWAKIQRDEYLEAAEEIERFFNSIDKAPRVRFPRKPGEPIIYEPKTIEEK